MTRLIAIVVVALTLAVAGAIGIARPDGPAVNEPSPISADVATGLTDASVETIIAALQSRLRELPGDAPGWANLALAYVEMARLSGDATLYDKADEAAERSLEVQPTDNAGALAARAAIAAARHDFGAALRDSDQALDIDPYHPSALALRVDALTELGRYGAQLKALKLADRRQPGLLITTRYSYAFELRGKLDEAVAVLTRAAGSTSPADQAFVMTLLADLNRRRGKLLEAASNLRAALRAVPDYVPALVSRARLSVAQGKSRDALARWQDIVRKIPLPEYLTELGELQLMLGQPARAARSFGVVSATNELLSQEGVNTDLESALFEADHGSPELALKAARAEWARRQSVHVADVLAWALHRAGSDRKALRYARVATQLGSAEARFWLHRGTIEASLGMTAAARTHLRRGLAADPGLSVWQVAEAELVLADLQGPT